MRAATGTGPLRDLIEEHGHEAEPNDQELVEQWFNEWRG